jgi:hypothetical protein
MLAGCCSVWLVWFSFAIAAKLKSYGSPQLRQGTIEFRWDVTNGQYIDSTSSMNKKHDAFAAYQKVDVKPSFASKPRLILSVIDLEQPPTSSAQRTRWHIEPVDVSLTGFGMRLTQWGPNRLTNLSVQWTAIE